MNQPFISVILASHDKRKYFFDAIDSIHKQTLSPNRYEVLIVKDYLDEEVDSKIEEYGFKSIFTEEKSFQGKIKIGVLESKGEILTFLEDDDIYTENRLEIINEEFIKHPLLIYYHNSHTPIDYKGNTLERSLYYNITERNYIENGSDYEKSLSTVASSNPDFNTSTMAIRKSTFMDSMPYFEKMTGAVDNFIFYCSAKTGGQLLFDPKKLTYYRIHSSQTIRNDSYETYMKKRDQKAINLFKSYGIILEMTIGTPAQKIWENEYYIYKSYLGIFQAANGDKQFLPGLKETIFMAIYAISFRKKFILLLIIWTYLFRVSPRLFRYPYYRYKMWELARVSQQFELN